MNIIIELLPLLIMAYAATKAYSRLDDIQNRLGTLEYQLSNPLDPHQIIRPILIEITNLKDRIEILEYQQRARDTLYTPIVKTLDN